MSHELRRINSSRLEAIYEDMGESSGLSLTSFFGGERDGRCVQLTLDSQYVGLTEADVRRLVSTLAIWLDPDVPTERIVRLFRSDR